MIRYAHVLRWLMIHPRFLAEQLEAILENLNRNVISVDEETAENASIALNRMLATL